jgi:uncharacterized protein (DUF1697 family)
MAVKIALLRGVNVGGNKTVPMPELKAALEKAGFGPVQTHLNSGNVVFEAGALNDEAAAGAVAAAVKTSCGVSCPVMVRSAAELQAVLAADPYPAENGSRLLITFLDGAPRAEGVRKLEGWKDGTERVKVIGREVFAAFPDGMGRSKLMALNWNRLLGADTTGRNRNTVQKLVQMAQALEG